MPDLASPVETARFVARENRFVVQARRTTGELVRAYLPNTARLTDLLVPHALLVLQPADDPGRRTAWTVTRVWDGTWVSLEASAASRLVADHLTAGRRVAGWPVPVRVRPEVRCGDHRVDLELTWADGRSGLVEVKSLSRARGGVAPLSGTPSVRGVRHLATLARQARAGRAAAVVFVVQRGDVTCLDVTAAADPTWTTAVARAATAGVEVVGFACRIDEHTVRLARELPVLGLPAEGHSFV